MGSGCKYGAHFVAYPGSPLSVHASLSVRVVDRAPFAPQLFPGQRRRCGAASIREQISYSRLQQGVVKKAMYAWLEEEDEVEEEEEEEEEEEADWPPALDLAPLRLER